MGQWSLRITKRVLLPTLPVFLLASAPAGAGVPDPTHSTIDGNVMVASALGMLIPSPNLRPAVTDGYLVVVYDNGGTPLAGVTVTMFFAGSGLQVHATQYSPANTANCSANTLSAVTNGAGRAIFYPAAWGSNMSPTPNVQIRVAGMLFGTVRVPSLDLSNSIFPGRLDLVDVNLFRLRFFGISGYSTTDPDCDWATEGASAGRVDISDFNVFRNAYLCLGSVYPCGQYSCSP